MKVRNNTQENMAIQCPKVNKEISDIVDQYKSQNVSKIKKIE
jgi:hypothetical protein